MYVGLPCPCIVSWPRISHWTSNHSIAHKLTSKCHDLASWRQTMPLRQKDTYSCGISFKSTHFPPSRQCGTTPRISPFPPLPNKFEPLFPVPASRMAPKQEGPDFCPFKGFEMAALVTLLHHWGLEDLEQGRFMAYFCYLTSTLVETERTKKKNR